MGEIEDRLERLAAHRTAQVPAFWIEADDLVRRRDARRRAPVMVAIAACLAVVLVIGGLLLLFGGDDPSSVQTPVGTPPAATPGCVGKAYVDNNADGTVLVINTATGAVSAPIAVGSFPYGLTLTPDGRYAYVSNGTPIASSTHPSPATIAPDGHVYVPGISGSVSVIRTATGEVSATIPVGNIPGSAAFSPDGTRGVRAQQRR